MKNKNCTFIPIGGSRFLFAIASASLISMSFEARGAVSIGLQHFDFPYGMEVVPISNSDLVNTGSPDLLYFNSTFPDPSQTSHDGTLNPTYTGLEEEAGNYPGFTTFYLNTVSNPLGYRIDSIAIATIGISSAEVTHALYVGSSASHNYSIDYSVIGSDDFTNLTTIDISVLLPGTSKVTLLDLGLEEAAIDVIRIKWLDPLPSIDSWTIIGEIDIMGEAIKPIPEPGLGLMVVGASATLLRRTRRR